MSGRVVIPGGSGFIGGAVTDHLLARGYEVVVLTRAPERYEGRGRALRWDGRTLGAWAESLESASAVLNLAGKSVDTRYTLENRREIVRSRVDSARVIGEAIGACERPPPVWVQSGTLAVYGDAGDRILDETGPPGEGFSVFVSLLWERALAAAETPSTRKVALRIGFVLAGSGGALDRLTKLAGAYLGGTVGSGRQYLSWLHIDDLSRMILEAIEEPDVEGVYNATGPQPVTNRVFMRELRRSLGRPWSPPAPAPAVRIGAWAMGTEPELALAGRRCVPRRFLERGFTFDHPDLAEALSDVVRR